MLKPALVPKPAGKPASSKLHPLLLLRSSPSSPSPLMARFSPAGSSYPLFFSPLTQMMFPQCWFLWLGAKDQILQYNVEAVAVKHHPIPPFFYKPESRVGSWGSWICGFHRKMISSKTLQHLLASPNSDGTKRYWRSCYSWWAGWCRDVGASDCLCYTWALKIRPSRLPPAGFPHPAEMTLGQKLLWADSSEVGHRGCAPQECFW